MIYIFISLFKVINDHWVIVTMITIFISIQIELFHCNFSYISYQILVGKGSYYIRFSLNVLIYMLHTHYSVKWKEQIYKSEILIDN